MSGRVVRWVSGVPVDGVKRDVLVMDAVDGSTNVMVAGVAGGVGDVFVESASIGLDDYRIVFEGLSAGVATRLVSDRLVPRWRATGSVTVDGVTLRGTVEWHENMWLSVATADGVSRFWFGGRLDRQNSARPKFWREHVVAGGRVSEENLLMVDVGCGCSGKGWRAAR